MVLAGFLIALYYTMIQTKRAIERKERGSESITPEHVFDMCLTALFAGIIGARILYIALDYNEFSGNFMDFFKVWEGGISVHGAIVGSTLYCLYYCKRHKLKFSQLADRCAPGFALGYAIGRLGCFLNGCCYGVACSLPWATRFLKDGHSNTYTEPSHPTQLYATGMNLVLFGLLHVFSKKSHKDGELITAFFTGYLIYRFIDEQFRKGATADIFVLGMTHAQTFSVIALPIALFTWRNIRSRKTDETA